MVELLFDNEKEWTPYGLTCLNTSHQQELNKISGASHGIYSKMAPKPIRVDQPSVRDIETTINSLDESIAAYNTGT